MPRTKQQRPRHILESPTGEHGEDSAEDEASNAGEVENYLASPETTASREDGTGSPLEFDMGVHQPAPPLQPENTKKNDQFAGERSDYNECLRKIISTTIRNYSNGDKVQAKFHDHAASEQEMEGSEGGRKHQDDKRNLPSGFNEQWASDPQIRTMLENFMFNPFRVMAKMLLQSRKQNGQVMQEGGIPENLEKAQDKSPSRASSDVQPADITEEILPGGSTDDPSSAERRKVDHMQSDKHVLLADRDKRNEFTENVHSNNIHPERQTKAKSTDQKSEVNRPESSIPGYDNDSSGRNSAQEKRDAVESGFPYREYPRMDADILEKLTKLRQEQHNLGFRLPLLPWSPVPPPFMLPKPTIMPKFALESKANGIPDVAKWTSENGRPTSRPGNSSRDFGNDRYNGAKSTPSDEHEIVRKRKHEGPEDAPRKEARSEANNSAGSVGSYAPTSTSRSLHRYDTDEPLHSPHYNNASLSSRRRPHTESMRPRSRSPLPITHYPALPLHLDFPMPAAHYLNPWPMIYPPIHGPDAIGPPQFPHTMHPVRFFPSNPGVPQTGNYSPSSVSPNMTTKPGKVSTTRPKPHSNDPLQTLHDQIVREAKEKNKGMDPENMYIECPVCRKRIKRLYHFQRHMRIHTGEKTHSCPNCPYKSVRKDNLKSHMKTHEKSKFDPSKRPQARREHPEIQNFQTRSDFHQGNAAHSEAQDRRPLSQRPIVSPTNSISPIPQGGMSMFMPQFGRTSLKQSPPADLHLSRFGLHNSTRLPFMPEMYSFPSNFHDRFLHAGGGTPYRPFVHVPPMPVGAFLGGEKSKNRHDSPAQITELSDERASPQNAPRANNEDFSLNDRATKHTAPSTTSLTHIHQQRREQPSPQIRESSSHLAKYLRPDYDETKKTHDKRTREDKTDNRSHDQGGDQGGARDHSHAVEVNLPEKFPVNSNNCNNTGSNRASPVTSLSRYVEHIPISRPYLKEIISDAKRTEADNKEEMESSGDSPASKEDSQALANSLHTRENAAEHDKEDERQLRLNSPSPERRGVPHFTNVAANHGDDAEDSSSDDAVFTDQSVNSDDRGSESKDSVSPSISCEKTANPVNFQPNERRNTGPSRYFLHGFESRTRRISSAPELDEVRQRAVYEPPIYNGRKSADETLASMTDQCVNKPPFSFVTETDARLNQVHTRHHIPSLASDGKREIQSDGRIHVQLHSPSSAPQYHPHSFQDVKGFGEKSPSLTTVSDSAIRYKLHPDHMSSREFKCRLCNFLATNNSSLQEHMTVHKEDGLYKCQECDYRGKNLSKLVEHKRIHTGERPFQCDQCSYAAKRKDNLAQHKSVKHDKNRFKGPARVLKLSTRLDHDTENRKIASDPAHSHGSEYKTIPVSATSLGDASVGRYLSPWNSPPRDGHMRHHPLLSGEWFAKFGHGAFPDAPVSEKNGLKISANDKLFESPHLFRSFVHPTHPLLPYGTMTSSVMFGHPLVTPSTFNDTPTINNSDNASDGKMEFALRFPDGRNDAVRLRRATPGANSYQKPMQECAQ